MDIRSTLHVILIELYRQMPIKEFVFCYIGYLGAYPPSCAEFAQVSPNVVADESVMKTDEGRNVNGTAIYGG